MSRRCGWELRNDEPLAAWELTGLGSCVDPMAEAA